MARKISPFLMFEGQAENAMRFYVSLFPGSEVIRLERYGPGESGAEGSVKRADFVLAGQAVICIDSPVGERDRADALSQLWLQQKIRLAQRPLWRVVATQPAIDRVALSMQRYRTRIRHESPV